MEPKFYRTYVTTDKNGQEMLYLKLQKALYGLLRVVILFCRNILTDLIKYLSNSSCHGLKSFSMAPVSAAVDVDHTASVASKACYL